MKKNKCKICRRLGSKLFLKGERCFSPKCSMVKKPYPPGMKAKRRKKMSEYNRQLREKQKLRNWYNLDESQFRSYIKEVLKKRGTTSKEGEAVHVPTLLIQKLESRLDNMVLRMGFADSRSQARQIVSHGHVLVNGKKVNISSYQVKIGDEIKINPKSIQKEVFKNIVLNLNKKELPSWVSVDIKKLEGKVENLPLLEDVSPPVEISMIFEFYSR
jgi:small subunit ribosomal protein S4